MINLARQAFVNPFVSPVGASFQPGTVGSVGRCPGCGSVVALGSAMQPQIGGFNPVSVGATFGQQMGGSVPTPFGLSQATGFGQINPLTSQFTAGSTQGVNPLATQLAANWPAPAHLYHQGVGGRAGAYGIDPRNVFGIGGQQFAYADPNAVSGIVGDPITSLLSQQVNPLAQQQLPIRPLIGGQQALGGQPFIPGFAYPITQWNEPYKTFIEAQLLTQLANNPLYQLQRAYGGVAETPGLGMPFGAGQQFNPFFGNVPFYG